MKEHPELSKYQWTHESAMEIWRKDWIEGLIERHNEQVKELLGRISVLSEIGAALATK